MVSAVFPGSFDPFTKGHLNILIRALGIFDKVYVAVGKNSLKKGMFTIKQRIDIISKSIVNQIPANKIVEVISYDCLTVELCKDLDVHYIIRGVRNMLDFENERAISDANKKINPEIDTIIIPTEQEFGHISSTAVRDILLHNGDTSNFMCIDLKQYKLE